MIIATKKIFKATLLNKKTKQMRRQNTNSLILLAEVSIICLLLLGTNSYA
jgi:hypothetical protein